MSTTSAASDTSKTTHKHRTDKSKSGGYKSVPTRSLEAQLRLLQHVLEGMQKHGKDTDYPTALDGLGVSATYDVAVARALAEASAKLLAKKATGEAVGERTLVGVMLEKIQDILVTAYGRRSMTLLDYGFRPLEKRRHRSGKAAKAGAAKGAGTGAGAATSPAGSPAGGAPGTAPA